MRVLYTDPNDELALERELLGAELAAACSGAQRVDTLVALLERADIVSLHLPLNGSTRGLVNAEFLARMRPGSLLVNTDCTAWKNRNLGLARDRFPAVTSY